MQRLFLGGRGTWHVETCTWVKPVVLVTIFLFGFIIFFT